MSSPPLAQIDRAVRLPPSGRCHEAARFRLLMRYSTMWGLLAALMVASSGVAAAELTPAEQARRLSDEGLTAFREQRYAEAIAKFEASYALAPLPLLIFDIAQAYRLQGDCAHALELYRRYQRET